MNNLVDDKGVCQIKKMMDEHVCKWTISSDEYEYYRQGSYDASDSSRKYIMKEWKLIKKRRGSER